MTAKKSQFCKSLQRIFFFKTIESIIKFLAKFVKQLKIFNERKKKYVPVLNVKKNWNMGGKVYLNLNTFNILPITVHWFQVCVKNATPSDGSVYCIKF